MGRIAFENYGHAAEQLDNYTVMASRYLMQEESERHILPDIINKLDISVTDQCLDIGCNVGTILIPLSFYVRSIHGIDHLKCLETLEKRFPDAKNVPNNNVHLIPGNFLDLALDEQFDKIIVYSVLHQLVDENEVFEFILKAIALLKTGGKLLLGDLPNTSKEDRFLQSAQGKAYQVQWEKRRKQMRKQSKMEAIGDVLGGKTLDSDYVQFDDRLVLAILSKARELGCNAYVFPQSSQLPFGYVREDILIEAPLQ